jgi:Flp pilus assembly protein TadG
MASYIRWTHATRASEGRSGVVAAEVAIVVPVLLLFALAAADFGRISQSQQIVSNAARTAAEFGATRQFSSHNRDAWEADVRRAAMNELESISEFVEADVEYELSTSTDSDGIVRLAVTVAYPFRTVISWPGMPTAVTLRQRIEFRQFR